MAMNAVNYMLFLFAMSNLLLLTSQISDAKTSSLDSCKDVTGRQNLTLNGLDCLVGGTNNFTKAFSTVKVTVKCKNCKVLHGNSLEDVRNAQSIFEKLMATLEHLVLRKDHKNNNGLTKLYFSPFMDKFIHIEADTEGEHFEIEVETVLDITCLALVITGTVLFYMAPNLATSVKFYYTGGVGIGIFASILIIVFILSRFIPKKPAAYSILIGGWGLGAWIMRMIWTNWQTLLMKYRAYFLGYIAIAGFLSFALCYWKGPVENPKSQRIIQWMIQIFSLFMLYTSSRSPEVSMAIISGAVVLKFLSTVPDFRISSIKPFFKKFIWAREDVPRLLTEEEYRIQGEIETRKALEDLKRFCDSPQCSPWKTMSRLKSPEKFIKFMEGEGHTSEAEMTLHENEVTDEESVDVSHASLISEDGADMQHGRGDCGVHDVKNLSLNGLHISEDED